jgi:hypothetical protein
MLAHSPGAEREFANVDETIQKCAGCQHDSLCLELLAIGKLDAVYFVVFKDQVGDFSLDQREIWCLLKLSAHLCAVDGSITLGARGLNGWAAAAIEQAEVDADLIRDHAHEPAKRVNLAHQMAFSNAADGRVAGHLGDQVNVERDKRGFASHPGGSMSRFAPGVASANDDHIEFSVEAYGAHLPIQKVEKI